MKSLGLLGGRQEGQTQRRGGSRSREGGVCVCVCKRERFEDATPLLFLRTQEEGVTSQGVQAIFWKLEEARSWILPWKLHNGEALEDPF